MSQQSSSLEVPLRVIGPNGAVLWQGSGWLGSVLLGKAFAAITRAAVLVIAPTGLIIQSDDLAATFSPVGNVMSVNLAPALGAAAPVGIVGVALASAAVGEQLPIAGTGSIVPVLTTAVLHTVGEHAQQAASGVLAASAATLGASPRESLGHCVKNQGTTGGVTDTGSATRAGYLVVPHKAVA